METFKQIVPQGSAVLKLVKNENHVAESQRSFPSQFPNASQQLQLRSKLYKSIKVYVSFSDDSAGANADHEEFKLANNEPVDVSLSGMVHLSGG